MWTHRNNQSNTTSKAEPRHIATDTDNIAMDQSNKLQQYNCDKFEETKHTESKRNIYRNEELGYLQYRSM